MELHDRPILGLQMLPPEYPPLFNDMILWYEIIYQTNSCNDLIVKPRPSRMNMFGWISVIITSLIFLPASCIPCCLSTSYNVSQRPVYGSSELFRNKDSNRNNKDGGNGDNKDIILDNDWSKNNVDI